MCHSYRIEDGDIVPRKRYCGQRKKLAQSQRQVGGTAREGIRSSTAKSEMSSSSPTKPSLGSEKAPSDWCLEKGLLARGGLALKEEKQGSYMAT